MGLDDALTQLQDADPEEAADRLQSDASEVWKAIRNPAFKKGQQSKEEELSSAQDKIASLRKEKQEVESKLDETSAQNPEVEDLREQYEAKINSLQDKIGEVKEERDEAESQWKQRTQQVKGQAFQEKVASRLQANGVDDQYAEFYAEKAMNDDRVQVQVGDDSSIEVEVFDDGVPIPTNDTTKSEALATMLVDEIDDRFIVDERPSQTMDGSPAASVGDNTIKRSQFDSMSPSEKQEFSRNGGEVVED